MSSIQNNSKPPVQTGLDLSHDARGDRAKRVIRTTVEFDLSALRDAYKKMYQTQRGEIRLSVGGQGLSYTF